MDMDHANYFSTLGTDLILSLPGAGAALIAGYIWWLFCFKWLYKEEHEKHLSLTNEKTIEAIILARSGSPAERVFLAGLLFSAVFGMVLIVPFLL